MKKLDAGNSISSITELLAKHFTDDKKEVWFRGQSDYEYELIPTIFREKYNEAAMYEEFIRRFPEHSNNHRNVFEWLTLMQHYGLPTRLLDWTTNLLVALFFCCDDKRNQEKDGAIFVFINSLDIFLLTPFDSVLDCDDNHAKLLEPLITSTTKEFFLMEIFKLCSSEKFGLKEYQIEINNFKLTEENRPSIISQSKEFKFTLKSDDSSKRNNSPFYSWHYPYKPSHKNSRIRQQQGCFTFHGGKYFGNEEFIAMSKMEEKEKSLVKIRITASNKEKILKELKLLGINEATLFPEMEYQAKQIKELYKYD